MPMLMPLQTFRIPEQSITLPFLLVGHVSEPRVAFERPGIAFGQCLVSGHHQLSPKLKRLEVFSNTGGDSQRVGVAVSVPEGSGVCCKGTYMTAAIVAADL